MSGREKVGLHSKSSNLKKDEKNLEEKKERDITKTRSQVKINKNIVRAGKVSQDNTPSDGDKGSAKSKVKPVLSRRKNSLSANKTTAVRKTRHTDDLLELNTKLIKRSPTIIDKLISKNKSAIKKNQQNKRMPEKSEKDDQEAANNGTDSVSETASQTSKKIKTSPSKPAYNIKRKQIDVGKLLTTTLARKKLKASQARIEMSVKKRLLRSNNSDPSGDKNSLFNLDQKRKLNRNVKILKRKVAVGDKSLKKSTLKKGKANNEVGKTKLKDMMTTEDNCDDEKNTAGPSNSSNLENGSEREVLKSKRGRILQTGNSLSRPLKKFPVNSVGYGVNRWKVAVQPGGRGRGRGRGGRVFRGRGRGFLHKRMPYLTRSDSPVPLLRNGKRRNCDSTEDKNEGVKKRRRNISSDFSKSESLPDDQSSCATDSEYSFCDSASIVTKVESFDGDDIKIKTEVLSLDCKETCSDKIDANSNVFTANQDEISQDKKVNPTKVIVTSSCEFKREAFESKIFDETKGCDCNNDSKRKLSNASLANSDSCPSFPLDSKLPIRSCRRLSLDLKIGDNLEDSTDCDTGDKNISKAQKTGKKSDISERKKINRSLWVRRSLRGVQKNSDSDGLSEILKLAEKDDGKIDSAPSDILCLLSSDDKSSEGRRKSNEFDDPAVDFCLQIEDSPLKTDNELLKPDDDSSCKIYSKEEGKSEHKILNLHHDEVKIKNDNFKPCKIDSIYDFHDENPTDKAMLDEVTKTPFELADNLKVLIEVNDEKEKKLVNAVAVPSPIYSSDLPLSSKFEPVNIPEKNSILNENINNNNDNIKPVLKDEIKKTIECDDDDVVILDTSDEIITIDHDGAAEEKDLELIRDSNDRIDDVGGITFFKTKDLVEKEKIDEIIESLEVSDDINDKIDETEVIGVPETVLKESMFSSSMTKDIAEKNSEIKESVSSVIASSNTDNVIQFSSETEFNNKIVNIDEIETCKNNDSNSFNNVLLDDYNSKDNIPDDKLLNPVDKPNDDNLNFSDQSSSSSSFTSAVTELPTSVDSDALEMGDNLSSNDWNDKHYDMVENNIENSLNIECMNNVTSNNVNKEIKVFDGVNFDSSSICKKDESNKDLLLRNDCQSNEQVNLSGSVASNDSIPKDGVHESTVNVESLNISMNQVIKIKETPEEIAKKESILSALGLQSLHTSCDEKSKKPDNNYTGTLKAVIKLNRAGDKKSGGRKMFFKQCDLNSEKDIGGGGDMLEYRICSEADQSNENGQVQTGEDGILYRKSHIKQRTVSLDETSNSSISAFTWTTTTDPQAVGDGVKDEKGAAVKQSNLVIPEKSSSFSIHPGRLCSDICSYCFGKFGSLDTPCHLAQLKNAERQQKILSNEAHLKMDSCLCDGCYRYVDRKANCPQSLQRSKKQRRALPNAVCSVQNCTQSAQHSIRRKWLVKLKKSISKKLDIDMDKNPHLPFPLCNQHYYWVDYFTVCGICKKRLTRNHMYALGAEANELNAALKKDGIPVRLSDKLFLCKLCRYYSSLRLKYKDISVLNANHKLFLRSYKKKILTYLDIAVSESEEDPEKSSQEDEANSNSMHDPMKSKKRKSKQVGHEAKKRKMLDDKLESCDSVENSDEPQMIDYSYLDTLQIKMGSANKKTGDRLDDNQSDSLEISSIASLFNPLESRQSNSKDSEPKVKVDVKPTRIQVKFGNLNIGKLSNLNIGQDSRTGREKQKVPLNRPPHLPGERELPLVGELKQEDNLGRNGWEKYTLSLQFDGETKKLWNELQRPYGNQSSFLRHLVMLEKYWRSGSLVLADNADPRAVKYNQRAKNRVQAYESVSVRPSSTYVTSSATPVSTSSATSTVTVTSSLSIVPLMTASTSSSSVAYNLPEVVEIVTPMSSASSNTSLPVSVSTSLVNTVASTPPPPPPPPLLKLDSSVMWQKFHPNAQNPPLFTLQNSQFVRPIKVVVSSMSNSSSGKSVPNVISVLTGASNPKTTAAPRPIKMTFQQFQSFQKRCKKDIKITPAMNITPVMNKISVCNPCTSSSSTTITASAALAAAKAVTTVTTATSTPLSTVPKPSSADTFIPLICDVRSLAGTSASWGHGLKTSKGSKVTYYTPILPKLPNTISVRHIVPSTATSVPLNSSVTIEKAPSEDSVKTSSLVPEKPSISVFREDCSNSGV